MADAVGAPVLSLESVQLLAGAAPLSLTAREGEVIVVTGLLGSGKSRLAEIIFGLARPLAGSMQLDGAAYDPDGPDAAVARGVFMSPKDRGSNAVIPAFDIANNMTVPFLRSFSRLSLLSDRAQRQASRDMIARMGVVCRSDADSIGTLSGGNQQKVMIGRWLMKGSRVLLLDEPFQGVDIGARRDIGAYIRASAKGRATLVFVSEIDEALEVADRIVVLHEGARAGEHDNQGIDLAALVAQVSGGPGALATGAGAA